MLWEDAAYKQVGNADPSVSPYLKAWIGQDSKVVCGVIAEGTTKELLANWTSPFADKSLGNLFQIGGGMFQALTDLTSVSTFNSRLIWEGNESHAINLVLRLYALHDAKAEVADAIMELEKMASPELNEIGVGGRIPGRVNINIGRMFIWKECVICSMQVPLDKEKVKDGHLVRADVSMQIKTLTTINKSLIASTYG